MHDQANIVPSRRVDSAELAARTAELAEVEERLADREMLLKTVQSGLRAFETSYLRAVRPKFAERDRLEAEIAEAMLAFDPDDETQQALAQEARARAAASAKACDDVARDDDTGCHTPSVQLKRLFRRVALSLHPDLSGDPDEHAYRHELMVEANLAYRNGDDGLLEELLELYEAGGAAPAERAELRRVLWLLSRARRRLVELGSELEAIEASELFDLWRRSEVAAEQGRDFIRERVGSIERSLAKARARLEALVSPA